MGGAIAAPNAGSSSFKFSLFRGNIEAPLRSSRALAEHLYTSQGRTLARCSRLLAEDGLNRKRQ
jgi:acetate kinase